VQLAGGLDCDISDSVGIVWPFRFVQEPTPAVSVDGHTQ
jgi:hypothetical protein